ncbi:MAG: class I SAM-dependent methyltransferase [Geminicoccaceae bacterium]
MAVSRETGLASSAGTSPAATGAGDWSRTIEALRRIAGDRFGRHPFRLVAPDGSVADFGQGEPAFTVRARSAEGMKALASLDALSVAHAYMAEEIDIDGNLVAALYYQEGFGDFHPLVYIWRRLQPLLVGRPRVNPAWIALHYDAQNAQLAVADQQWHTYTPGIYLTADEPLEPAADRKLAAAFESLQLKPGQRLLEIGCGWGGMTRYSASRGVNVTGITLSKKQKAYVEQKIAEEKLPAQVFYQDFFTYRPQETYDAISMMGVIEDLSDYRQVMRRLVKWVKPGGRVYLDFAAERERFNTHSFVTKYIWPGTFRMVFMPEFVEAVRESPFELWKVENDRWNYHVWSRQMYERWTRDRAEIEAEHGPRLWRTFQLLYAAVAAMHDRRSHSTTAYRVVLELPADNDGTFHTPWPTRIADAFRAAGSGIRDAVVGLWPSRTPSAG